jgi:pimeloyl-ACP methyl ester carboxylesterase
MKTVAYIHGLAGSHRSFNYMLRDLPAHKKICINYASHQPLEKSLEQIVHLLPKVVPISIVGHSLGGIIALLIACQGIINVERVLTISSPIAGSKAASLLRWVPGHPAVMSDVMPHSSRIRELLGSSLQIPVTNIISIGGQLGGSLEPNDSVVAISSQKALPYGTKIEVKANHFEVLSHERTVQIIREALFQEVFA